MMAIGSVKWWHINNHKDDHYPTYILCIWKAKKETIKSNDGMKNI